MHRWFAFVVVLFAVSPSFAQTATPEQKAQLAPSGALRAAQVKIPFLAKQDASGALRGVAPDLAAEMARVLGLPYQPTAFDSPNAGIKALRAGAADIIFLAPTPERVGLIDFAGAFMEMEVTLIVPGASPIRTLADADQPGRRIVVYAKTANDEMVQKRLTKATILRVPIFGYKKAFEMIRAGEADGFVDLRDQLMNYVPELPDGRIVPGHYGRNALAIGYAKERPAAAAFVQAFTAATIKSGFVTKAIERAGVRGAVAPGELSVDSAALPRYTRATLERTVMSDMRLIVAGAGGRMGRTLIQAITAADGAVVAGAVDAPGSAAIGRDAGELAGLGANGIKVTTDAAALLANADGLVDFTIPAASVIYAELAAKAGKVHILGTTGFSGENEKLIAEAAKRAVIVKSGNMSLGVNLLAALVKRVAATLDDDFDIEIFEMHHNKKIDAPSGTALMFGRAAAEGRKVDLAQRSARGRDGETGARQKGDIGFASLRGGTVVGDHRVIFAGPAERIELVHKAEDRMIFARGAVHAALWARGRMPGLYSMADVLGLKDM